MSLIRASSSIAAALVALGLAGTARADTPSRDEAMAETLFAEAKKLMASGDYASACPKLAESNRLDPGGGTLTALALCHEQVGKTATAWAEFIEVRTGAQQAGRADREKFARQHIAALEPTLSRLTILVDPATARMQDVTVKRDRVLVGPAAWGIAAPVDPGEHVVEARAPGKLVWSTRVVVGSEHDTKSVAIPELDDATQTAEVAAAPEPKAPPFGEAPAETAETTSTADTNDAQSETPPASHRGGAQRTAGLVIGIAGIVSAGVGSYFGVSALSESNDAKKVCSPESCTDPNAIQSNDSAKSNAVLADVFIGGGLVAVLAGAILFFTAPSDAPSVSAANAGTATLCGMRDVRVLPSMASRGGGVILQSRW